MFPFRSKALRLFTDLPYCYRFEDNTEAYDRSWKQRSNYSPYEYVYRSESELQGNDVSGHFDTYSAAGYTIPLNGSARSLRLKIQQLQDEHWIDINTRGLFIEFSVYNAQTNHFAVIRLSVEVPPSGTSSKFSKLFSIFHDFQFFTGAYFTQASVQVVRLIKYIGPDGTTVIVFEILYILLCIVFFIKELYGLATGGTLQYLKSFWKISDVAIVISSLCSLLTYWLRTIAINEVSEKFLATNGNAYVRLNSECDLELRFLGFMAIVVFLLCLKMMYIL
uniref:PKD_channel domain-containing protein n=1 Tax=Syphacia muris TaxID=451379 RepID=A0A0N5ACS3_9BILA